MKKNAFFADVLTTVTKYFLILVAVVVLFILLSGIRVVESGNVAVVLRFGKLVGDSYEDQVHEAGLLFSFPYFIDEVVMIPKDTVIEQSVTTHYTAGAEISALEGGYVITGDQSIAVVSASVKYKISDPVAYTVHVNDITTLINATVSTAMVNESARIESDSLLTDGKDDFAVAVMDFASEKLKLMEAGVTITSLELTQVAMAEEVRDSYEEVNSSTIYAETMVERAYQYEATVIPEARATKSSLVNTAEANKALSLAAAETKLAEFWGLQEELAKDPDNQVLKETVFNRVYNAKYIQAIKKIGKVIAVKDGETNIFLDP